MAHSPASASPAFDDEFEIAPASIGNMGLLVQLRWVAVAGQLLTIAITRFGIGAHLPLAELVAVPVVLALMNVATWALGRHRSGYSYLELLGALMLDVEALSWQLYFTGGATNPFIFLFLVQIMIGAILLPARWSGIVALIACCDVAFLTFNFRPLVLPPHLMATQFQLHLIGSLTCFVLIAMLLVYFVVRMDLNQRASTAALAALRQRAAEEQHIIRMGLLASGAAHELGTPMASLSVILGDMAHHKTVRADNELGEDIATMQTELARCKSIVSGILMSAGEVRGDNPQASSVRAFLGEIVADWQSRTITPVHFDDRFGEDVPIIADPALRQVIGNVIDNALEVSPAGVAIAAWREAEVLMIDVRDSGPGFTPNMLANYGRPYLSTKGRDGGGLGLFLVVNVLRQLGGRVSVSNPPPRGALVRLSIPLPALAFGAKEEA
jgi:two-component system sensor histidine kinase RegB